MNNLSLKQQLEACQVMGKTLSEIERYINQTQYRNRNKKIRIELSRLRNPFLGENRR
jgi:hypothetical protein